MSQNLRISFDQESGVFPNMVSSMLDESKTLHTLRNRGRIEDILAKSSRWGHFFEMNVSGLVRNETRTQRIDITQNLHRIEDYDKMKPPRRKHAAKTGLMADDEDDSSSRRAQESKEPLNIMLFYADDWTMKVLGKLNPQVITPNIDAMADQGMIFTRNCVTTSICWISRNTLATGLYAAVHKTVRLPGREMFNKTVPWLETLYPLLKQNGYYTGLVGKWHAQQPAEFMKETFDHHRFYMGDHWMHRGGKRRHVTDLNGEDALTFLRRRPKDKKFALTVSFFATHAVDGNLSNPYQPMPESLGLYSNVTIPRPQTATEEHWQKMPWFFDHRNVARIRHKHRFDEPSYDKQIKNLYRLATEVDSVIGAIIDELKSQGVYNQTLLVFTTDNGNLHGEHGLAEKWYPFEESVRVPLVIQDPRMPESAKGSRNDEFTLSVDLAPTILSAAQIKPPKFMQGRDIAQLYLKPEEAGDSWRQDFFYEWNQGDNNGIHGHGRYQTLPSVFALIRKDYKYFYWPQLKYEQLFCVENDPYEESDILNSTMQTTQRALHMTRARFSFLKSWAQSGNPV